MATPALVYAVNVNVPNGPIDGVIWRHYFLASMTVYAAITAALVIGGPVPSERRSGWTQQLRIASVTPRTWLAVKLVAGSLFAFPPAVLIAVLGMVAADVPVSVAAALTLAVVAGTIPFAALGLVLGYVLDERAMQAATPLAIVTLALLGGLFWPTVAMPAPLRLPAEVLPSSRLADIARDLTASRSPEPSDVVALATFALVCAGALTTLYRRDQTLITRTQ